MAQQQQSPRSIRRILRRLIYSTARRFAADAPNIQLNVYQYVYDCVLSLCTLYYSLSNYFVNQFILFGFTPRIMLMASDARGLHCTLYIYIYIFILYIYTCISIYLYLYYIYIYIYTLSVSLKHPHSHTHTHAVENATIFVTIIMIMMCRIPYSISTPTPAHIYYYIEIYISFFSIYIYR